MSSYEFNVGDIVKTRYPAGVSNKGWVKAKIVYIHPEYYWCCVDCGTYRFCKQLDKIYPVQE